MPKSLDIVGHVAILEITPELIPYKALIGEAVLSVNKNIRTVLAKASPISAQYRLREFEILAGEDSTETVHSEYGCKYLLDVRKVYFSPRLGYEHDRVSRLVNESETVVDMFAGIGPFSILIGKRRSQVKVYAIDVNPEAMKYLEENVRLNRVAGKVVPLLGDCRGIVRERLTGLADRVIMNLPEESLDYVDLACEAIKPTGGIMHLYTFSDEAIPFEELKEKVKDLVLSRGRSVQKISETRIVKAIAPYRLQVVVDATVV
jgi:tRNA (guanine37-N1)-methyltransferase